ncbi:MAG: ABC transporter ATP-binding protein [Ruminococcaceae bacterium]|nr:ABC transporter ATP-binding protein [Oscillospiraceae bacterium]
MLEKNYLRGIELCEMPPQDLYISELPVVKHLFKMGKLEFNKPVTFLVGENGTGKSTLLEAIAVAVGFNAEGGGRNFTFSTNESHSPLWKYLDTIKSLSAKDGFFLRAESLYNLASNIDEMDKQPSFDPMVIESYGGVSLHKQSHGESFMSLIENRLFGNGFYIFDEPEAALSPMRLLTLIAEIDRLVKNNSQIIIATHSPILMAYPNAQIIELSKEGIKTVDYRDTEHYKVTKQFLDNPERMIKYLIESEC